MRAKILFVFLYKKIAAGSPTPLPLLRGHAQIKLFIALYRHHYTDDKIFFVFIIFQHAHFCITYFYTFNLDAGYLLHIQWSRY